MPGSKTHAAPGSLQLFMTIFQISCVRFLAEVIADKAGDLQEIALPRRSRWQAGKTSHGEAEPQRNGVTREDPGNESCLQQTRRNVSLANG